MPPRECIVVRAQGEGVISNARAVLVETTLVCYQDPQRTRSWFANVCRTLSTRHLLLLVSPAHPELKPSAELEQVVVEEEAKAQSAATQRSNARTFIGLQTQLGLHSEATHLAFWAAKV